MKKRNSIVFTLLSFFIVIPGILNYLIFTNLKGRILSKFKEYHFDSKHGKIRYIKKGSGKPLLLIHGISLGGSLDEWENTVNAFSKKYTVYAIDLLGFGNSQRPAISYSSYLYLDLINDFIENVIQEPSYVIANENSSSIAVMSHSFRDDLIEKMVLIAPTGVGGEKPKYTSSNSIFAKILNTPHFGTALYNMTSSYLGFYLYLKNVMYFDETNVDLKLIKKYHKSAHAGGVHSKYPIHALITEHFDLDIQKHLEAIDIPVKVIWGKENVMNPVSSIENIENLNEDIDISVMDHTRALPHVERADAFVKICLDFFER